MYGASATNSHRGGASFLSHHHCVCSITQRNGARETLINKYIPIEENDLHRAAILSKYHDAAHIYEKMRMLFLCANKIKQTNKRTNIQSLYESPSSAPLALTCSRSQSTYACTRTRSTSTSTSRRRIYLLLSFRWSFSRPSENNGIVVASRHF